MGSDLRGGANAGTNPRKGAPTGAEDPGERLSSGGPQTADCGVGAREPRVAKGERDLKSCFGYFSAGVLPATANVVAFKDRYRDTFAAEPICQVLRERSAGIVPSIY